MKDQKEDTPCHCLQVAEEQALIAWTIIQQAKLIAHTCALQLAKGQSIILYTDSKYTFHILLSYAVVWKERGLLTKRGSITNPVQVKDLTKASHLPLATGLIHSWSQQVNNSIVSKGSNRTDEMARTTTLRRLHPFHSSQDNFTLQHLYYYPQTLEKFYLICISSFTLTAKLISLRSIYTAPEDISFLTAITVSCKIC